MEDAKVYLVRKLHILEDLTRDLEESFWEFADTTTDLQLAQRYVASIKYSMAEVTKKIEDEEQTHQEERRRSEEFESARTNFFARVQAKYGKLLAEWAPVTTEAFRIVLTETLLITSEYIALAEPIWDGVPSKEVACNYLSDTLEEIDALVQDHSGSGARIQKFLESWAEIFVPPEPLFDYVESVRKGV